MLDDFVVPGISTMAINDRVEDFIVNELKARPASKANTAMLCAQQLGQ